MFPSPGTPLLREVLAIFHDTIIFPFLVVTIVLSFVGLGRRIRYVPLDQAMVVYGRNRGKRFRVVPGGRASLVWPIRETCKMLPTDLRIVSADVDDSVTRSGVKLTIELVGHVRFSPEENMLRRAAETLLDFPAEEVERLATDILVGHCRAVAATMEVEQVNADRDAFGLKMRELAKPDLAALGLKLVSLAVKDIKDDVGYLEALGRKRTVEVKKEAILKEAARRIEERRREEGTGALA